MDKYSGKRAVGLGIATRGSGFTSKGTSNNEERNAQYCNKLGCSTRHNSMRSSAIGSSDRDKYSSPSFRSASGSSTRTYSSVNGLRKPNQQNSSSHKKVVCAETNNMQVENEISETSSSTSSIQSGLDEPRDAESGVLKRISVDTSVEIGSSSVASQTRAHKQVLKRSVLGNQDTSSGSSNRRSFAPRNTTQPTKPVSRGQASANRYGLKNLGCASISDVLPGCSSSDSSRTRRVDVVKKTSSDGECSTNRGKIMSGSSSGGNSTTQRSQPSSSSVSLPERLSSQQASRRTRNWPPSRDGITSVRTKRAINGDSRAKLSDHGNGNSSSVPDPSVAIPEFVQTGLSIGGPSQSSSLHQSPVETLTRQSSYGRPSSGHENSRSRPAVHPEDGNARLFSGLSIDRDGFRRFNMEGIAEVLLALERIEQDEELTYEQFLALETNLFLGGLNFHDQHRDMRLDIDNMSYEELLALEEKMGSVSTALTEETLSQCITNSFYEQSSSEGDKMNSGEDEVKCSICQEEYAKGDELGKLRCDHRYHAPCVQQWLRQKNWCPICKAPAADS